MTVNHRVVCLHMPKCAGSSMRTSLRSLLRESYKEDYDSLFRLPVHQRCTEVERYLRRPEEVGAQTLVWGHLFPVKYLGTMKPETSDIILVTFLREPLSRLASHYSYWRSGDFSEHYLWRKMIREDWSFARFALAPEMRNFLAQHMIQVPLSRFNFIGIHEQLEESWERFMSLLNLRHQPLPHTNMSSSNTNLDNLSEGLRSEIAEFHAEDYWIYDHAVQRFNRFAP